MKKSKSNLRSQAYENIGYLFILPAVVFMIAFVGYPILYNIKS